MAVTSHNLLQCGRYSLDLARPRIMGILNVTPDSFSDGGQFVDVAHAVEHALRMQEQGAAIIDVGGESTRPGAPAVSLEQEIDRVMPIIEALVPHLDVPLSVDTSKPELMRLAVQAGAGMINDVNAFRAEGAEAVVAGLPDDIALVLMHMQGQPRTMQQAPYYDNVLDEVGAFLQQRCERLQGLGIRGDRIVVDPGIGFGKTLGHNLSLLKGLPQMLERFQRVLLGVSRKSMFAQLLGLAEPEQRVAASVQTALLAAQAGVGLLRVHDVQATNEALCLLDAIQQAD